MGTMPERSDKRRLILCLDGTWMNSDKGDDQTSGSRYGTLAPPTNVTRMYRSLQKRGPHGESQIMYYHPGVGSTGGVADSISGGLFGDGVGENIREAYSFIATNYEPGDEIILIGFSRGAFTARGVAALIDAVGLLNSEGLNMLYPIFKDVENMHNPDYKDKFPYTPFPDKFRRSDAAADYKKRLFDLTRVSHEGIPITVRCVAVWETVGSLALALDEDRTSFAPAVWERPNDVRTDLRQVWFCGAHSNVGGGLRDQELANVSMAWMMDQLTSIGVTFYDNTIDIMWEKNMRFFFKYPDGAPPPKKERDHHRLRWAHRRVYDDHYPVRPWALGEIVQPDTGVYRLAGKTTRTPGQYHRVDPKTGLPTPYFLKNTNERVHSSVRVRLDLGGLGYDDEEHYKCRALLKKGLWEPCLIRTVISYSREAHNAHRDEIETDSLEGERWGWVYRGPKENSPPQEILMEEPLGPWQNRLLSMSKGMYTPMHLLSGTVPWDFESNE
ncbi:hypothetical protein N7493_008147 [Penicillium malachiteum]|uniref:T6SS Phospholipase effector Tle1-like catalytic domain-containing protein n=1 Tax=Penicillium malachiteum TaxID=1324776 RepID=A0AAD6HGL8_9EURO|nr:hypothetical protein N7493_008147 [Penicillium malachiteum]